MIQRVVYINQCKKLLCHYKICLEIVCDCSWRSASKQNICKPQHRYDKTYGRNKCNMNMNYSSSEWVWLCILFYLGKHYHLYQRLSCSTHNILTLPKIDNFGQFFVSMLLYPYRRSWVKINRTCLSTAISSYVWYVIYRWVNTPQGNRPWLYMCRCLTYLQSTFTKSWFCFYL